MTKTTTLKIQDKKNGALFLYSAKVPNYLEKSRFARKKNIYTLGTHEKNKEKAPHGEMLFFPGLFPFKSPVKKESSLNWKNSQAVFIYTGVWTNSAG